MLTSIPFISEGREKSPFPQPDSSPDPWNRTHLRGSTSTWEFFCSWTSHWPPQAKRSEQTTFPGQVQSRGEWLGTKKPQTKHYYKHTHTSAVTCEKPELDLNRKIQGKEEKGEILTSYTQKEAAACVSVGLFFFFFT